MAEQPYSEVAEECRDRCFYGICNAPGSFQGCGGCCGCLGPCVVTYEKSLPDEQAKAEAARQAGASEVASPE